MFYAYKDWDFAWKNLNHMWCEEFTVEVIGVDPQYMKIGIRKKKNTEPHDTKPCNEAEYSKYSNLVT